MSRFAKTFHIIALLTALCCIGGTAIWRHMVNWPVIEFFAFLATGYVIFSLTAIFRRGISPHTPTNFSVSITSTAFYLWTGGESYSGIHELPYAAVFLLIAILSWLASRYLCLARPFRAK